MPKPRRGKGAKRQPLLGWAGQMTPTKARSALTVKKKMAHQSLRRGWSARGGREADVGRGSCAASPTKASTSHSVLLCKVESGKGALADWSLELCIKEHCVK